jgi:hypothetical protein
LIQCYYRGQSEYQKKFCEVYCSQTGSTLLTNDRGASLIRGLHSILQKSQTRARTILIIFPFRPTPAYSWTFKGLNGVETPITSGENGYELQDYNHFLMITTVETKHDGWYKCRVSSNYSGQAHVDEKTARLFVKGLQKFLYSS